jgi:hypothetical protein
VPDVEKDHPIGERPSERADPVGRWAASHAPLLATVGLFVLVVIRILRVSAFDPATAAALVRETGIVSIVMGALVSSLPGLLQATAVLLTFFALGGPGSSGQRKAAWTITSLVVLLLTVVLPWLHLIIFLLFLVIIALLWAKLRWPLEILAVAAVLIGSLLDVSKVWLPPENVRLTDGRLITGYVLSVDGDWTSVFAREQSRNHPREN